MSEIRESVKDFDLDQTVIAHQTNKMKTIGNVKFLEDDTNCIGKGASAKVYVGEYTHKDRPKNLPKTSKVAVKVINKKGKIA